MAAADDGQTLVLTAQILWNQGHAAEAISQCRQACRILESTGARQSTPDLLRKLADAYECLGSYELHSGSPRASLDFHEKAAKLYRLLTTRDPGSRRLRRNMADCSFKLMQARFRLAEVYRSEHNLIAAREHLQVAKRLAEQVDRDVPIGRPIEKWLTKINRTMEAMGGRQALSWTIPDHRRGSAENPPSSRLQESL
jgi:tetratricopeptide (TPR) repeat protein